eukprot:3038227-Pleurochrysis_carterae.AAC.1
MLISTHCEFFSGARAVFLPLYAGAAARHTLDAASALVAFAAVGVVAFCLVVLLRPTARAAKLLASSPPARASQARNDRGLF